MNRQIYEEASLWLVELRVGDMDAAARAKLDAWFRTSPEHIRAYLELSSLWEEGADKDLSRACTTAELIARARETHNVVPIATMAAEPTTTPEFSEPLEPSLPETSSAAQPLSEQPATQATGQELQAKGLPRPEALRKTAAADSRTRSPAKWPAPV
ncbi:MAG: FecR/PupR family sigma factor regulator, partial [Mycobacteriales bacterium]